MKLTTENSNTTTKWRAPYIVHYIRDRERFRTQLLTDPSTIATQPGSVQGHGGPRLAVQGSISRAANEQLVKTACIHGVNSMEKQPREKTRNSSMTCNHSRHLVTHRTVFGLMMSESWGEGGDQITGQLTNATHSRVEAPARHSGKCINSAFT